MVFVFKFYSHNPHLNCEVHIQPTWKFTFLSRTKVPGTLKSHPKFCVTFWLPVLNPVQPLRPGPGSRQLPQEAARLPRPRASPGAGPLIQDQALGDPSSVISPNAGSHTTVKSGNFLGAYYSLPTPNCARPGGGPVTWAVNRAASLAATTSRRWLLRTNKFKPWLFWVFCWQPPQEIWPILFVKQA